MGLNVKRIKITVQCNSNVLNRRTVEKEVFNVNTAVGVVVLFVGDLGFRFVVVVVVGGGGGGRKGRRGKRLFLFLFSFGVCSFICLFICVSVFVCVAHCG